MLGKKKIYSPEIENEEADLTENFKAVKLMVGDWPLHPPLRSAADLSLSDSYIATCHDKNTNLM